MKILFIFMDGVGLGELDPQVNPFIRARLTHLERLLDGNQIIAPRQSLTSGDGHFLVHTKRASLLALDACLGMDGTPQSATGQSALLTGKNVPMMLGSHDGPKPNLKVMEILKEGSLFSHICKSNGGATLLNAFPPRYFNSIESGHRLPGTIALAASYAGIPLRTKDDLICGEAISADFTAQGWRDHLGIPEIPLLNPDQAGKRLGALAENKSLAFFEYWLSDMAGHRQDMKAACELLEMFDVVLGSLVDHWDDDEGLILITSDHGNLEDLRTRHHTRNDVPLILIGSRSNRETFITELTKAGKMKEKFDLTDITPAILNLN